MLAAVDDPVADAPDALGQAEVPQDADDGFQSRLMVGSGDGAFGFDARHFPTEGRLGRTDALGEAGNDLLSAGGIHDGKLGRGTAAVEDEDLHGDFQSSLKAF